MTLKQRIRQLLKWAIVILLPLVVVVGIVGWYKLFRHVPQEFEKDTVEEYFKYGSIGAEEEEGTPYYIWIVLPRMFPEYLPKDADGNLRTGGYAAFGTVWGSRSRVV